MTTLILANATAGGGDVARAIYLGSKYVSENPEESISILEFLVALVIFALIAGVVAAIAAGAGKFIFDTDKETTKNIGVGAFIVLMVILVICYFIA